MIFRDRTDAGRQLASILKRMPLEDAVVIALPRGGVVVGNEVARALNAPLDIIVARKVGAPGNPEFGVGAVTEEGVYAVNREGVRYLGIEEEEFREIMEPEAREVARRLAMFGPHRPVAPVKGKTVLLVDDGLATGVTAIAAARLLRKRAAARVILAVPVAAPESAELLRSEVDDVVCVETPDDFGGVGSWYEDFSQVSDQEVMRLLDEAQARGRN